MRSDERVGWLGAYTFNLVAAELVSVGIGVVVIVAVWPDVPWNLVWALSVVLAIAMPILFFPFSRDLWLAFDLVFRPTEPDHVTEHRTTPRAH